MGVNKFNSEGYYDPTAFEAIKAITKKRAIEREERKKFRPLVYVCSPFAGDTVKNIENARRYCAFAVRKGAIPIAPHLLFPQFLNDNDPQERELGLFMGMVLLSKCTELWIFGENISHGMQVEIDKAKAKDIQIRYFTEECREVFKR